MTAVTPSRGVGGTGRKILLGALLSAAALGMFSGCAGMPQGPTYTEAELKAQCERRGGWWRGNLIPGFCEYQAASMQSP
jgi:hypothetical protein